MDIEVIKENVNTCKLLFEEKKKFFVEGDVNVPDIKPDILNMVNVYADVFVTDKEIIDRRLKIDGTVDVYAIYLADDENGSIKSIMTPLRFTEYVELNGAYDDSWVDVKASLAGVESKITNNRKIAVRCGVNVQIKICKKVCCEVGKSISDNRNMEFKNEKLSFKTLCDYKSESIQINETIQLNENDKPIGEILKSSIKIINKDFKTSYNKILAKAEALVKLVYVADDESFSISSFVTRIPVMSFIEVENLSDSMNINIDYNVKNFLVKPIYQDLKATSFTLSSDIEVCAWIYNSMSVELITDLYSTEKETMCKFDSFEIMNNSINAVESFEISQNLLIPELDSITILDVEAVPSLSNANFLDGKIALDGNLTFDVLYYRMDKKIVENKRIELPFQQVVKMDELQSNMMPNVAIMVDDITYKVIGQNQLQIDLKLVVGVTNDKKVVLSSLSDVQVLEEYKNDMPSFVVYYVQSGDSLWSIAKRFHTKISDIMAINELKDDLIYPGEQLIIPKRRVLQEMPAWM